MAAEDQMWDHVSSYVEVEGLELDDLEIKGSGGARRVVVLVDGPEGVDVDRLADISRGLARYFDEHIDGSYLLEVSSPGLERSLRRPSHYRKAVGSQVKVKARAADGSVEVHIGTLRSFEDGRLSLTTETGDVTLELGGVTSAKTMFDLASSLRNTS